MNGQTVYDLNDYLEIKMHEEDQITIVEWIKSDYTDNNTRVLVGTLLGHLYLY